MIKKFLSMVAIAGMVMTTSCSSDEFEPAQNGGEAVVSFTTELPSSLQSRAFGDGTTAKNLSYFVYDENWNYLTALSAENGEKMNGLTATVNLQLVNGETYNVVFWADAVDAPYTFDKDNATVAMNYNTAVANDEDRDAFYKVESFTVNGNMTRTVELKRPFAQINIGTSDWQAVCDNEVIIEKTGLTVNAYQSLNLKDGEAIGEAEPTTFAPDLMPADTETFPVAGDYKYLSMNYILAQSDKELVEVTINYDGVVQPRTFTGVPVQRNYRTNIYGKLITSDEQFNVEINPIFDGDHNELTACYITNLRTGEVYQSFAEAYKNTMNGDELQLSSGKLDMGVHGINGRSLKIYGPNKGVPADGNRQPEAVIVGNVYQPWTAITATNRFEVEFDGVEMAENFYVDVESGITNLTIKNSIVKSTTAKIANKENRIVYIHAKYRPSTVLLENNLFVGKGAGDDRLEIWMYGDKGDKLGIGSSVNAIIRNNVFDNTVLNLGGDMAKSSFILYDNTYLNDSEYWLNGAEKEETGVVINLTKDEIYTTFAEAYKNSVNGDELQLSAGKFDMGVHGINGRSLKIYGPNKGVPANGNRKPEAVIVGNVYQPWTAITATNKFEVEFDGVEMAENFYVDVESGITNLTIKNSIVKSTTAKIANKENRIVYIHAKYRPSTVVLENNLFEGKGTGDDRLEIWMYGDKGDKLGIGSSVTATIKNNVFDNAVLNLGGDLTKSSFDISGNTYQNGSEYWMNGALQENK